ncbi:hypothetical protein P8452_19337 [Trifolium repens]|nr:hypothetical protein P8452_19337 [Trifolium repens]
MEPLREREMKPSSKMKRDPSSEYKVQPSPNEGIPEVCTALLQFVSKQLIQISVCVFLSQRSQILVLTLLGNLFSSYANKS